MKEKLKIEQPVAFQIVENEFLSNKKPHAFLIAGKNCDDLISFIAQSILCDEDIACESCNVCSRVKRNLYPDIIRINGKESSIKKRDIEKIQIQMAKSSLEGRGKVYIIEEIENSSKEAVNSILKMLEEPMDNVYAIFTTTNIDRVLPTVISRCQVLKLNPNNKAAVERIYLENKFSKDDAYVLSRIYDDFIIAENFPIIRKEANNFLNDLFFKKDNLIINAQINILNKYSKKEDISLFISILIVLLRELYKCSFGMYSVIDDVLELQRNLGSIDNSTILNHIEILLETEYQLNSNVNLNLLMDKMMYQLLLNK